MIVPVVFSIFLIGLVAIHMTRPRFNLHEISAARFFKNLPPPKNRQKRLNIGNPLKSLPLYFQFFMLALLLTATLLSQQSVRASSTARRVGLWVLVDTSASMSTTDSGQIRILAAQKAATQALLTAQELNSETKVPLCARLSAFDLERRDIIPPTTDLSAVDRGLAGLTARPLGTNLTLLQEIANNPDKADEQQDVSDETCSITHLIIVSDLPAPEWASKQEEIGIVWMDIATPVGNAGITAIHSLRDPITAKVYQVQVELTRYGIIDGQSLRITSPGGQVVKEEAVVWGEDNLWQGSFQPADSGLYIMQVLPDDAYRFDNEVSIDITTGSDLKVDWRLADNSLLRFLPWQQDAQNPDFRVVASFSDLTGQSPELLVGPGYKANGGNSEEINYFIEGHPLLKDLNFDVAVESGNAGQPLPEGFEMVLASKQGVWIAQRKSPPAVYVPGLPQGDGNLNAFSTTVFFNAVRWLLQVGPQPPLYTLTTPQQPLPEGNRTALHEDEGDTARTPASMGSLDELRPIQVQTDQQPTWPFWVAGAILVFLVERLLFAFGGDRWQ